MFMEGHDFASLEDENFRDFFHAVSHHLGCSLDVQNDVSLAHIQAHIEREGCLLSEILGKFKDVFRLEQLLGPSVHQSHPDILKQQF